MLADIPVLAPNRTRADKRAPDKRLIEGALRSAMPAGASQVTRAMAYSVLGEAGRVRPLLAVNVGQLSGASNAAVLRCAVAVELVHSASLIVDDLPCMDNDEMRRGRPSVHVAFGEATAILAAHSLVALAARHVVADCETMPDAALLRFQCKLLGVLDPSSLTGGQEMDLAKSGSRAEINEKKTAPLFRLAVEAGMVGSRCTVDQIFALRSFGREFGLAFQLVDDYLDGELASPAVAIEQLRVTRRKLDGFGIEAEPLRQMVEDLHERMRA
jgi:farnesyl diphosphate synthase